MNIHLLKTSDLPRRLQGRRFHFTCKPLRAMACKAVIDSENMPVRNICTAGRYFQPGSLIAWIRLTAQTAIVVTEAIRPR